MGQAKKTEFDSSVDSASLDREGDSDIWRLVGSFIDDGHAIAFLMSKTSGLKEVSVGESFGTSNKVVNIGPQV